MSMDLIPFAAQPLSCQRCGQRISRLTINGRAYDLDDAVHGLTERFDAAGRVVAYDHLNLWPGHACHPTPAEA